MAAGPILRRAALVAAAALLAAPGAAQRAPLPEPPAPAVCGEHVVTPGETLGAIASRRPGTGGAAAIYALNRDRLSDPDHIEVGQSLRLPCAPGASERASAGPDPADAAPGSPGPAAVGPALQPGAAGPGRAAPAPAPDGAPGLEAAHGLAARVQAALAAADEIPGASGGLVAPLVKPDCARLARLDFGAASRCARYAFSAPLASAEMVWIVRAGAPEADARTPEALRGLRICRPAGLFDGDLAAAGLAPPRAARAAPATAGDCLAAVASGAADAASLEAGPARAALAARGADAPGAALVEAPALASRLTLHAAAPRGDPEARAALDALDAGLALRRGAAPEAESR